MGILEEQEGYEEREVSATLNVVGADTSTKPFAPWPVCSLLSSACAIACLVCLIIALSGNSWAHGKFEASEFVSGTITPHGTAHFSTGLWTYEVTIDSALLGNRKLTLDADVGECLLEEAEDICARWQKDLGNWADASAAVRSLLITAVVLEAIGLAASLPVSTCVFRFGLKYIDMRIRSTGWRLLACAIAYVPALLCFLVSFILQLVCVLLYGLSLNVKHISLGDSYTVAVTACSLAFFSFLFFFFNNLLDVAATLSFLCYRQRSYHEENGHSLNVFAEDEEHYDDSANYDAGAMNYDGNAFAIGDDEVETPY